MVIDTGGTFTDLVLPDAGGRLRIYKSATTPADPTEGILKVIEVAARDLGTSTEELLARTTVLVHGTTRAINAVLTRETAKTAYLTTAGHPDVLLFREGGRTSPFDFTREYPEPYVPRALTYEVPERISASGTIVQPLNEKKLLDIIDVLRDKKVVAIGVCFLWSIVNPSHEIRVGELLREHLPHTPLTLSHQLNPILREYRRAISTAIDASLKPLMSSYLSVLESRLSNAGFHGELLMLTSAGHVVSVETVVKAPIHALGSGPAMAPIAGMHYARLEAGSETAVVADTGGTSYDVSLVRAGRIPRTRETWLGPPYASDMTGFPSIDVKSIGAGGGSIAWVDGGALLRIGPRSAGADPGPACYAHGGKEPTVTDASVALGYVDPDYFLGGAMKLDAELAKSAIERRIAIPLGLDVLAASSAIMTVASEGMVHAIEEITVNRGIDPRTAVLVAGGGAAGLNAVEIGRRLQSPLIILPDVAPALSAAGGYLADLGAEYATAFFTKTDDVDFARLNHALEELIRKCATPLGGTGDPEQEVTIELIAEARYPYQVWEIEVPLSSSQLHADDIPVFLQDFHDEHRRLFAISEPTSPVEIVGLRARVRRQSGIPIAQGRPLKVSDTEIRIRKAFFSGWGVVDAEVFSLQSMVPEIQIRGPALIESPITTVVIDPEAVVQLTATGSLVIQPYSDTSSSGRRRSPTVRSTVTPS